RGNAMQRKIIAEGERKTWALIFSEGEDPPEGLLQFAESQGLTASQFSAIGAFSEVDLGFFEMERQDYKVIPVREQVEVLSFIGDITMGDKGPKVHAHVVLGKKDGTAWG